MLLFFITIGKGSEMELGIITETAHDCIRDKRSGLWYKILL